MYKLIIFVLFSLVGCSRSYDWISELDNSEKSVFTYNDVISNTEMVWEDLVGPISLRCYSAITDLPINEVAIFPDECKGQSNPGCIGLNSKGKVIVGYIKTGETRERQLYAVEHIVAHAIAECETGNPDFDHNNGTELFVEVPISKAIFLL